MAIFQKKNCLHSQTVHSLIVAGSVGNVSRFLQPSGALFHSLGEIGHGGSGVTATMSASKAQAQCNIRLAPIAFDDSIIEESNEALMLQATDLIRVADLVKLSAETARFFSDTKANGVVSRISEAASRLEAAAADLRQIGEELRDAEASPRVDGS